MRPGKKKQRKLEARQRAQRETQEWLANQPGHGWTLEKARAAYRMPGSRNQHK